ncbi:hypothetical protein CDAR_260211 [Caerostris darwini]|uniref:Uncharacterized protein n=1 Tax=Caerostris darwini TaxID=1538125 RepID=A0AAV4SVF8_9ARAC|nr:hypothetical protein CDAR_260211 [Caerostris darwini]
MKMTELKMNIKCVSDQYVRGRSLGHDGYVAASFRGRVGSSLGLEHLRESALVLLKMMWKGILSPLFLCQVRERMAAEILVDLAFGVEDLEMKI